MKHSTADKLDLWGVLLIMPAIACFFAAGMLDRWGYDLPFKIMLGITLLMAFVMIIIPLTSKPRG